MSGVDAYFPAQTEATHANQGALAALRSRAQTKKPGLTKAEPDIVADLGAELAGQGEHIPSLLTPFGAAMGAGAATPSAYDLRTKLPEIHKLVQSYGFKSFLHGGRYGSRAPEHDFQSGLLPVHDPGETDPQQFNTENAKQTLIQLARALTKPEIDKLYGPAPSPESDVHWEDLASRKQRELAGALGMHISDDVFNREHNCAMANAVHVAVASTLPNMEQIGFVPHSHEVPLSIALDLVRGSQPMAKAEPKVKIAWRHKTTGSVTETDTAYHDHKELPEPKENYDEGYTEKGKFHTREEYKKIHPRKMRVHKAEIPAGTHSTVEGFTQGLKALPKGSPARGKFITQHMNHPNFIAALQTHPQGAQIHKMLTAHLNSPANAGPGRGVVTAKSESAVIFSTLQEKNVANPIDRQAALDRIKNLTAQIEDLRKREMAKALIPPHKHNVGTTVSSGIEDVAPAHLNPQGKNDPLHGGTAVRPMVAQKAELCKGCGKSECACIKKDELVDPKGKQSCNGVVTKMPATSKEVSAEGSGGQIKKGKTLSDIRKGDPRHAPGPFYQGKPWQVSGEGRNAEESSAKPAPTKKPRDFPHKETPVKSPTQKAEPPMAKPPSGANMGTKTPVSKPGNAMKPAAGGSIPKPPTAPKMPPLGKGVMSDIAHRESQAMGAPSAAPTPKVKLPAPHEQEDRAAMFADAMAGAYKPPAPVKPIHRTTTTVSVQPQSRPGIFARLNNPK